MELGPLGCGWICTSDSHNKQLMEPNHKPNQRSLEARESVDKIPNGEAQRAYVNTSKASEALRTVCQVHLGCGHEECLFFIHLYMLFMSVSSLGS